MATYLFDTNAVQSIRSERLQQAIEAGHELLLSPISVWELLSHLRDENFRLAQANALRVSYFTILHDPLAEIMSDINCASAVHPSRFTDGDALKILLGELTSVTSYAGLNGRQVMLANKERSCESLSENIESVFEHEHAIFARAMEQRVTELVGRYGRSETINLGGQQFCHESLTLAHGLLDDANEAGCDVTLGAMADRTVLGAGYAVARACMYAGTVGAGRSPNIDPNDLEDYFICLHLGAMANRVIVTNDRGFRKALARTLTALNDGAEAVGMQFTTTVRVLSAEDFIAETSTVER